MQARRLSGVITWRRGKVVSVGNRWSGAVTLKVALDHPIPGVDLPEIPALAYPELVGEPEIGHTVLLNVSALARGLGTGGYGLVVAFPDNLPPDPPSGPGHLVKARYTPLQTMVLGVDEQESDHHDLMSQVTTINNMPVVVADLHSALPAIIAGVREKAPEASIAYVMTDGGTLPAWFSRAVDGLRQAQWLSSLITVGQAFGGDLEAVSLHSGLLAARHVAKADIAIVTQGPGNLGTGTPWGFSGVAAGEAINAAGALEGVPVAALRVSGADPRPRHRGVSHHSLTAYRRVALAAAHVPVPDFLSVTPDLDAEIDTDIVANLRSLSSVIEQDVAPLFAPLGRHRRVDIDLTGLTTALHGSPVRLSTMGRGLAQDPANFLAVAAAGRYAGSLLSTQ